jgi:creatinine amidohydrolase
MEMKMDTVCSAEMSWRQIETAIEQGAAAIFPLGSTEEHGPHAPTGDFMAAEAFATRVAERTGDVVFPCLPFGYSEYFRNFPGTITLQNGTLFRVVEDVVDCLISHGFEHIVLFNGHKGNEPTLSHLIRKIRRECGLLIPIVSPLSFALTPDFTKELYGEAKIGHGGEPMGSVMMYLFPDMVDLSRTEDWATKEFHGLSPVGLSGVNFEGSTVGFAIDMEDITPPSGSLSDPQLATAERGRRIVERAVERLTRFMVWFKSIDPQIKSE